MQEDNGKNKAIRQRMRNALWGMFISDALSMPSHWYYNLKNIQKVFNGEIQGYVEPPHPHIESFMVGMDYHPDLETALKLGRAYDILHEHARFYDTNYGMLSIKLTERAGEHGNAVPQMDERFHYHYGLRAGENTLGAHLVRVLMRSVIRCGRYDPNAFLDDFIEHLTTPGRNRDPYTEIYIRRWFENYSRGIPAHVCAESQRKVWSIGAHGGIIRPMVVSTLVESAYQGLGLALEHQNLTHYSENAAGALGVLVPVLNRLLKGNDAHQTVFQYTGAVRLPQVTGEKLSAAYRDHQGPGNIPKDEMWKLHTTFTEEPFDIESFARNSDSDIINNRLSTACYPEHGLPLLLYLAWSRNFDFEKTLLANANAGGDNVHRGMVLGLIVGAMSKEVPEHLKKGLIACEDLEHEIDTFTDVASSGKGI